MKSRIACGLTALLLSMSGRVLAQEAPYLDDRSDAASLVRSLYNAINRKEFARAWSYFGETKPAESVAKYSEGFADTERVDVKVGAMTVEGAAGSTYFAIPVAIEAHGTDGPKVFGGCYTARLADPAVQAETFQPMQLEKGELKASDKPLAEALPASCGEGQAQAQADPIIEQAKAAYAATNGPSCNQANQTTGLPDQEPLSFEIKFHYGTDAPTDPERIARLISFQCFSGAYNLSNVYYLHEAGEGLRQIEFPVPDVDIKYQAADDDTKVESVTVKGFYGQARLMNSEFQPGSQTIVAYDKWRGVGDASSTGTWAFRNGNFVLVRYEVDASYDGEMNAETVVDYDSAP